MLTNDVQAWTRCRLPVDRPLPFDLEYNEDVGGWRTPLRHLLSAPGYKHTLYGRNVHDPEEVIFMTRWSDSASLQAFTKSAGFASYFEALGIQESDPHAFVRLRPPFSRTLNSRVMIWTFSFESPVTEEMRSRFNLVRALDVSFPVIGQLHVVSTKVWIKGLQVGENGQLVEHAMLILPFSMARESRKGQNAIQERVTKDSRAREKFNKQVAELNLKIVEEVTWDIGSAEYD